MVPPTRVEKAPSNPRVLQAVLVKIVIEILFGNAPLADHETTVLAAATDQLTKWTENETTRTQKCHTTHIGQQFTTKKWEKIKRCSILTLFWSMTVAASPPWTPGGGFGTACACDFRRVT